MCPCPFCQDQRSTLNARRNPDADIRKLWHQHLGAPSPESHQRYLHAAERAGMIISCHYCRASLGPDEIVFFRKEPLCGSCYQGVVRGDEVLCEGYEGECTNMVYHDHGRMLTHLLPESENILTTENLWCDTCLSRAIGDAEHEIAVNEDYDSHFSRYLRNPDRICASCDEIKPRYLHKLCYSCYRSQQCRWLDDVDRWSLPYVAGKAEKPQCSGLMYKMGFCKKHWKTILQKERNRRRRKRPLQRITNSYRRNAQDKHKIKKKKIREARAKERTTSVWMRSGSSVSWARKEGIL